MANDRPPDNQITIRGFLSKDAESRGSVVTLNIPVNSWRKRKDAAPSDKNQQETNWFKCVCFKDVAGQVIDYRKGTLVEVTGSMEQTNWTNKEGVKVTSWELHAKQVVRIDRNAGAGGSAGNGGGQRAQAPQSQPADEYFDDDSTVPF